MREKKPGSDWILIWVEKDIKKEGMLKKIIEYARENELIEQDRKWLHPTEIEEVVGKVLKHIMKEKDPNATLTPERAVEIYNKHYVTHEH